MALLDGYFTTHRMIIVPGFFDISTESNTSTEMILLETEKSLERLE